MSLRVFTAIPVPDFISESVLDLMDQVPGARWRSEENLHITLAFYGTLDESCIEDLDIELGRIALPGFKLSLKGVGHFGSNPPSSIWACVKPDQMLSDLARACHKAGRDGGVDMKSRAYLPHLTLAYLPKSIDVERVQRFEQRHNLFQTQAFKVDRFHLYSSHDRKKNQPNAYRKEAEYPLL